MEKNITMELSESGHECVNWILLDEDRIQYKHSHEPLGYIKAVEQLLLTSKGKNFTTKLVTFSLLIIYRQSKHSSTFFFIFSTTALWPWLPSQQTTILFCTKLLFSIFSHPYSSSPI
jgi:hypothetical protein